MGGRLVKTAMPVAPLGNADEYGYVSINVCRGVVDMDKGTSGLPDLPTGPITIMIGPGDGVCQTKAG